MVFIEYFFECFEYYFHIIVNIIQSKFFAYSLLTSLILLILLAYYMGAFMSVKFSHYQFGPY